MAEIKSLADIAEKWIRVTPGRVEDYKLGIQNPKRARQVRIIGRPASMPPPLRICLQRGSLRLVPQSGRKSPCRKVRAASPKVSTSPAMITRKALRRFARQSQSVTWDPDFLSATPGTSTVSNV